MINHIANDVPISIIAFDLEGVIRFANPTAEDLLGLIRCQDAGSFSDKACWQPGNVRQKDFLESLWSRLSRPSTGAADVPTDEFELAWDPDGPQPKLLFVRFQGLHDENDRLTGWVAVLNDVTRQKQAESKLRESEVFYRTLFEHGGFGIALVDPDTGRRVAFNRKLHERLGYTREEYQHLTVADIQYDDTPENALARGQRVIRDGADTFEERQRTKDGKMCHVLVSAVPVTIGGRELVHAISLDITEKRQLEIELRQAQKMEAIGRLAGGVAHDFNNMLNVMIGYADLALSQVASDSQLSNEINEIRKAAVRGAELTRQLLAFSRKQIIAPRIVQLNDLINDQLAMLSRLIGEEISIAFAPGRDLWPIKIDPGQIHQILTNLAANARDAIGGVGTIFIETGTITVAEADDHIDLPQGDYIFLAVRDTGTGMDSATLEHIFEPFFTTKAEGKGTGLGLATVYGIVKQNDGGVQVYSVPGTGTTIRLYLPRFTGVVRDTAETGAARDRGGAVVKKPPAVETILVVEDEPALLELTTAILKRNGYQIIGARKPSEAIAVSRETKQDIHLLLTDVVMPEMNGMDLHARILASRPHLKTLFMSGYSADIVSSRGVIEQGVNFINKPFSIQELAQKVRQVLDT